ncbi:MAG: beta-lactamase family protein [Ectothiorhodospiraceae bacterium]|nr:beta-lactamase family protein [Ectothiorhodospiraceae bacterium]
METIDPGTVGLGAARLARVRDWMARYVDAGKLAGAMTLVARRGRVAFLESYGLADLASGRAMAPDTVLRFYSMTKPITSVAALMLYERGRFQLDDPLEAYLPAFADMQVWVSGSGESMRTEPARRPIQIHDLMTHTSGLTYGFFHATPVDAMYRARGIDFTRSDGDLGTMVDALGEMPLLAHPGSEWNYGTSTDVLGRLVEVLSGKSLGAFMRDEILAPLGMHETAFSVPAAARGRFAAMYGRDKDGGLEEVGSATDDRFLREATLHSGGGGLVSTVGDYFRFTELMRRRGELDGVRLLSRKTVDYMTRNHLPGGVDMAAMGQPRFSEASYEGIGFGLGVSVMLDPARAKVMGSAGEYAWGGAASTAFWIDPVEEMTVIFCTQLLPSSTYPLRRELRVLTYQAIEG